MGNIPGITGGEQPGLTHTEKLFYLGNSSQAENTCCWRGWRSCSWQLSLVDPNSSKRHCLQLTCTCLIVLLPSTPDMAPAV